MLLTRRFSCRQLRSLRSSAPRAVPERSLDVVVLARVWAALGAPARSWRSLGEEERIMLPTLSHGRGAFYFAGREQLFYGGTIALAAKGAAWSS
jgi:hypothetical protein